MAGNMRDTCKATCPFTYALLIDYVSNFCRERSLDLVVADIFAEEWVGNWCGFGEVMEFIISRNWLHVEEMHVGDAEYLEKMRDWIARLCMLVVQNKNVEVQTDEARLLQLQQRCPEHPSLFVATASGEDCNCLVDSLITVLEQKGFLRRLIVNIVRMPVGRTAAH